MAVQIGTKYITRYTVNQLSLDRVTVAYNQAYDKEFSLFKLTKVILNSTEWEITIYLHDFDELWMRYGLGRSSDIGGD